MRWPPRSPASPAPTGCSSTTASARSSTPTPSTRSIAFRASRYGKSLDGTDDYLNCPFDKEQYERFVDALLDGAESVAATSPRIVRRYFEACLPIEETRAARPRHAALRAHEADGPDDPRTGRRPYAVVQLRQENLRADSYNLVGFQNHLKFGEQARILRMIPGLENAEFLRFGQIHRNTYINAPALLTPTLQLRARSAMSSSPGRSPASKATWNRSPPA